MMAIPFDKVYPLRLASLNYMMPYLREQSLNFKVYWIHTTLLYSPWKHKTSALTLTLSTPFVVILCLARSIQNYSFLQHKRKMSLRPNRKLLNKFEHVYLCYDIFVYVNSKFVYAEKYIRSQDTTLHQNVKYRNAN